MLFTGLGAALLPCGHIITPVGTWLPHLTLVTAGKKVYQPWGQPSAPGLTCVVALRWLCGSLKANVCGNVSPVDTKTQDLSTWSIPPLSGPP